jgi:hypothetical protein
MARHFLNADTKAPHLTESNIFYRKNKKGPASGA